MHPARSLLAAFALLIVAASAQTAGPVARGFHPSAPLPSYDVATIKPFNPAPAPNGMARAISTTIRDYVRAAYAPSGGILPSTQVIGGPEWIDKDKYTIEGKPPADLELAMRQMKTDDRLRQDHAMRQSLLADRFHLRVHFEVREMPIYALVAAKSGLKIKAAADPTPPAPDGSPSSPATGQRPANPAALQLMFGKGTMMIKAHAISMAQLAGILGPMLNQSSPGFISMADTGRPVVDQTGFTGYFDIEELKWAPLTAAADSSSASDAPSLETALEETLGLRLVATKGPVEVVVIDSIDHPTEN